MTAEPRLREFRRFLSAIPARDRRVFALAGCGLLLLLLAWAGEHYLYQPWRFNQRVVLAKQNLHAIQLALERYAVDSDGGSYPSACAVLVETGYLAQFPANPFADRPMRELPPGDPASLGDFYYLPQWTTRHAPGSEPADAPVGYELKLCLSAK